MAKKDQEALPTTAGGNAKYRPKAHVSWPAEGIRMSGDHRNVGVGRRVAIRVEGKCCGHSQDEMGGSMTLEPDTIHMEDLGTGGGPVGRPMTDLIGRKKKG